MIFVGIDWSDQHLDFHIQNADGKCLGEGRVTVGPAGLADLIAAVEAHAEPDQVSIAIESPHGPWMQTLLDRGYHVYPVNPKSVESFREALSANGDKSDAIDRRVLAIYLATFRRKLRRLSPDDPKIISLRIVCQDRLRLVEDRTSKINELRAVLKVYYPAVLKLFGVLNSRIALEFLRAFPTQNQMQAMTEKRFRKWIAKHRYTHTERLDEMVKALRADALIIADHLQSAKAPRIQYLGRILMDLNAEIAQCEVAITTMTKQLPEITWARSLPGAGVTLAPAIIACFGRDTDRFETPADAQAFIGTAPVTKASGRSRQVFFRRGCWKFARRTMQLFADQSRRHCAWADRFYQKQRVSGHQHHQALRALAHKWVKIILAMQRNGSRYIEAIHVENQQRYLLNAPNALAPN